MEEWHLEIRHTAVGGLKAGVSGCIYVSPCLWRTLTLGVLCLPSGWTACQCCAAWRALVWWPKACWSKATWTSNWCWCVGRSPPNCCCTPSAPTSPCRSRYPPSQHQLSTVHPQRTTRGREKPKKGSFVMQTLVYREQPDAPFECQVTVESRHAENLMMTIIKIIHTQHWDYSCSPVLLKPKVYTLQECDDRHQFGNSAILWYTERFV